MSPQMSLLGTIGEILLFSTDSVLIGAAHRRSPDSPFVEIINKWSSPWLPPSPLAAITIASNMVLYTFMESSCRADHNCYGDIFRWYGDCRRSTLKFGCRIARICAPKFQSILPILDSLRVLKRYLITSYYQYYCIRLMHLIAVTGSPRQYSPPPPMTTTKIKHRRRRSTQMDIWMPFTQCYPTPAR